MDNKIKCSYEKCNGNIAGWCALGRTDCAMKPETPIILTEKGVLTTAKESKQGMFSLGEIFEKTARKTS